MKGRAFRSLIFGKILCGEMKPLPDRISFSPGQNQKLKIYICPCGQHLADSRDVVSRAFQGRGGKAFLFHRVLESNISFGIVEERHLMTGAHLVADLFCSACGLQHGWSYLQAQTTSQHYKEGRFILEKGRLRTARFGLWDPPNCEEENAQERQEQSGARGETAAPLATGVRSPASASES
jgi:hypothetical protein